MLEQRTYRISGSGIKLKKEFLLDLTCILWLCNPLLRLVAAKALSMLGAKMLVPFFVTAVIYAPLVLYILFTGKMPFKRFPWVFLATGAFFLLTYMLHPEYKHWYLRDAYGIFDSVFSPARGAIWAFLMVEISQTGTRLWQNFQLGSIGVFLYNMYLWLQAKSIGYWSYTSAAGVDMKRTYSLDFGYSMVFVLLVLALTYLVERKLWQLGGAAIVFVLVLDSGGRGALLSVIIGFLLMLLDSRWKLSKKVRNMTLVGIAGCSVLLLWDRLLSLLIKIMERFHIKSRTLTMLVSGEAGDDNGRDIIHGIIKKKIAENPIFGYGAFGDRQFIGPRFNWGYSHSILLEMWADFGVILGTVFLGALLFFALKMIFTVKDENICVSALVVLSVGARLAMSNTFWGDQYFWMMLALIFWYISLRDDQLLPYKKMLRQILGNKKRK